MTELTEAQRKVLVRLCAVTVAGGRVFDGTKITEAEATELLDRGLINITAVPQGGVFITPAGHAEVEK